MRKMLILFIIGNFIFAIQGVAQDKVQPTRIYLNNSTKTYAVNSQSKFTNSLIEALNSGGGADNKLNVAELMSFFQGNKLNADTVTYGKNEPGSDFVFQKATGKGSGKNYALLVYVEDYDSWDDLSGIKPDVDKIKSSLETQYGFETQVLENATRVDFLMAIRKYTTMEYGENDKLFIYFAGHGFFDDLYKWNYLVMKDSNKDDEVKYSYMPLSQLLMLADNLPVQKVMVIIDAGSK